MGRIKIEDLPRDQKISKEEMRAITGAGLVSYDYEILGGGYQPDVASASFITMMKATDDMEDDTRNILASLKSIHSS